MVLALTLVAVIAVVALTERSVEHLGFAIAALLLNAALVLIFVGDIERAILLSCLLAVAIAGASIRGKRGFPRAGFSASSSPAPCRRWRPVDSSPA